jgi:Uma2 family endonuclease
MLLLKTKNNFSDTDKTITLADVNWEDYLELSQQNPEYRYSYYKNVITVMSPSRNHERIKKTIAILIETYCQIEQIKFFAFGSGDIKKNTEIAKQPDESYCFETEKEIPDLAVEVVFSSGGIKDLEKYKALNVKEVWFWENNSLNIYLNTDSSYTESLSSFCLPKISKELLSQYISKGFTLDNLTIQNEFVKELRNLSSGKVD